MDEYGINHLLFTANVHNTGQNSMKIDYLYILYQHEILTEEINDCSLFSGLFPLPRIIYSMANDGLMFRWLGSVSPRFGTPFIGTLVAGLITSKFIQLKINIFWKMAFLYLIFIIIGFMAATFKLKQLVDLMSIGTLLAYAIVAACVLLLR